MYLEADYLTLSNGESQTPKLTNSFHHCVWQTMTIYSYLYAIHKLC